MYDADWIEVLESIRPVAETTTLAECVRRLHTKTYRTLACWFATCEGMQLGLPEYLYRPGRQLTVQSTIEVLLQVAVIQVLTGIHRTPTWAEPGEEEVGSVDYVLERLAPYKDPDQLVKASTALAEALMIVVMVSSAAVLDALSSEEKEEDVTNA